MSDVDLVIHLRRCEGEPIAAEAGLRLAARLGAHALGLHVVAIPPAAFVSPEAVAVHVNEADHLSDEARAREPWWDAQLARFGVEGAFQVVQGDPVDALCHAARWCDLVVAERPVSNPDAPVGWGIVSRTVFDAATPVVVVPDVARVASIGERIVIAWNGSREAMLAIRGALPLLRLAASVDVLDGLPPHPAMPNALPAFDLRAWLVRRGIDARFHAFRPGGPHGPAVLEAARTHAADLLVTGAWGQSRIAELVLGGATRHLFQHSDIPLLVAH